MLQANSLNLNNQHPRPPLKRVRNKGPRISYTNQQKQLLRKWWSDDSYGKREHKDAMLWWKNKFGTDLSTSTCSDILFTKWAYLDNLDLSQHAVKTKREHECAYSILEAVLLE